MSFTSIEELFLKQPDVARTLGFPFSLLEVSVPQVQDLHKAGKEIAESRIWDPKIERGIGFVAYFDFQAHKNEMNGFHETIGINPVELDLGRVILTDPLYGSRILLREMFYDGEVPYAVLYNAEPIPKAEGL